MKDIKEYIIESTKSKKCKFDNKSYLEKLERNINELDKYDSIAGLNCWDLAWSFGEYLQN